MTSAGLFFRCHLGYLLYERGLSVLIPNMRSREPTVWGFFSKGYVLRRADVDGKVLLMMISLYIRETKGMRKMLILIPPLGLAESLCFSYDRYALRHVGEVTGFEDKGMRDQKRYIELR